MEDKQVLTVINGEVLTLNGVLNILRFDEGTVTLQTSRGRIIVEGEGLAIESLDKNGGDILIKGDISGVYRYEEPEGKSGFFKRMLGTK